MSLTTKLRTAEVTPRTALMSIGGLLLLTVGVMTAVVKLTSAPSPRHVAPPRPSPVAESSRRGAKAADIYVMPRSEADYAVIISRNLFRSLARPPLLFPPAMLPPFQPTPPPPAVPISNIAPFQTTTTPPVKTSTRPKVAFTGVVDIAGDTYALLENLDTQLSQYTHVGSEAYGCKLVEIAGHAVTLEYGGETFTLNMGDNKTESAPAPTSAKTADGNTGDSGTGEGGSPPDANAETNTSRSQPGGGSPSGGRRMRSTATPDEGG